MTRAAADRGSRESPDGSVRAVAAQMPPVRIRIQNGRVIDDIAVTAITPNAAETTSIVTAAARQAAPSVRRSSARRSLTLNPTSTPKAASATGTTGSSKDSVSGDSRLMPWGPKPIPAKRRRATGAEVADHANSPRHRRDAAPICTRQRFQPVVAGNVERRLEKAERIAGRIRGHRSKAVTKWVSPRVTATMMR